MITLFVCENSAYKALSDAVADGYCVPENCTVKKIPCAGSLKKLDILNCFAEKGAKVLVIGCHSENCKFIYGNKRTSRRVDSLKQDMTALDIGPERLMMTAVSSVEGARIQNVITDFVKE